jgi:hypothetical protein
MPVAEIVDISTIVASLVIGKPSDYFRLFVLNSRFFEAVLPTFSDFYRLFCRHFGVKLY